MSRGFQPPQPATSVACVARGSADLGSNISPHAVRLVQLTGAPVSADGTNAFLCVHERRD